MTGLIICDMKKRWDTKAFITFSSFVDNDKPKVTYAYALWCFRLVKNTDRTISDFSKLEKIVDVIFVTLGLQKFVTQLMEYQY